MHLRFELLIKSPMRGEDMDIEGVDAMFRIVARVGRFNVQCSMPYHFVENASWRIGWSSLYGNIKKMIRINMR